MRFPRASGIRTRRQLRCGKPAYRFTTKFGEDYPNMSMGETVGEDAILHMTVHVK
jgi:hypothetical protein